MKSKVKIEAALLDLEAAIAQTQEDRAARANKSLDAANRQRGCTEVRLQDEV